MRVLGGGGFDTAAAAAKAKQTKQLKCCLRENIALMLLLCFKLRI